MTLEQLRAGRDATLRAIAKARTLAEVEEIRRLAVGKTGWLTLAVKANARALAAERGLKE